MIGRSVRQYQLIEKLGAGGMGEIYKAQDTRLNRFVAMKVLPASMSADPERRRRFLQEAQAASALNHPNIITIYDIVSDGDTQYMVVEYVAGKTLLDLIPKGGLRVPQVIQYASQMADALSAAHSAGIIHRDLKPANVMVTNNGLVKLLDFGLAKLVDRTPMEDSARTATVLRAPLTVEGTIMGTVNYMSPEQAEGKQVDARSDIFSFGAVLYEMLTGRSAFRGDSPISTLSAVLRDDIQPIVELAPDVPHELDQIVVRCLKKAPGQRFQSAQEVQAALAFLKRQSDSGALYNRPPVSAIVLPPPALPAQRSSKSRDMPVVLILVLAVAGVAGYWWMTHQRPAPAAAPVQPPMLTSDKPSPMPGSREAPAEAANGKSAGASSSLPVPPATPSPSLTAAQLTLGDGVAVALTLAADVPLTANAGDAVVLKASQDVRVNETVVIPKGAEARGVIVDAKKKKILGMGGKMTFRLESIDAVDGQKVKIRATPTKRRDGSSKRPVDAGGNKSKDVAAAAGSEYTGYIDDANTVTVRK